MQVSVNITATVDVYVPPNPDDQDDDGGGNIRDFLLYESQGRKLNPLVPLAPLAWAGAVGAAGALSTGHAASVFNKEQ